MTDSPSKRLFILDGMALAYRAHFAFFSNPIRNSKGVNTSAVYGFANTLLGILSTNAPRTSRPVSTLPLPRRAISFTLPIKPTGNPCRKS